MIEIRLDTPAVAPGGEVSGEVTWTPAKDCTPKKIDVSIGWLTQGRGDADRGEVAAGRYDCGPAFEGQPVRFPFRGRVPADAVPSFSGGLIRLFWHVLVRVDLPWAADEKEAALFDVRGPASASPAPAAEPAGAR